MKKEKPRKTVKRSNSRLGLAGEYYVLAELSRHGLDAALTLGHAKGIDILVSNPKTKRMFRVEVKTTDRLLAHENPFWGRALLHMGSFT